MYVFKKSSITPIYTNLVSTILTEGREVVTEKGELTKEIQDVLVQITNPHLNVKLIDYDKKEFKLLRIPQTYPLGENGVKSYIEQLLYGSRTQFSYDYHERLFEYRVDNKPPINQLQYCIEKLKLYPTSRRSLMITWNPYRDCVLDEDYSAPCLQYVQFLIRDNQLHMKAVFRSNDILLAFPANVLGLMLLGDYVAQQLNVTLTSYTQYIVSAHVYIERDRDYLRRWYQ